MLLPSAILWLRGTRVVRSRRAACHIFNIDLDIETTEGAIYWETLCLHFNSYTENLPSFQTT